MPVVSRSKLQRKAAALRGVSAEATAAQYLSARGVEILLRNVRFRVGELDLVCMDGGVLVIVEVRQRGRVDYGDALASVTWRKQRRITRAAQLFLQSHAQWWRHPLRFDVVALQGRPDGTQDTTWIRGAFGSI